MCNSKFIKIIKLSLKLSECELSLHKNSRGKGIEFNWKKKKQDNNKWTRNDGSIKAQEHKEIWIKQVKDGANKRGNGMGWDTPLGVRNVNGRVGYSSFFVLYPLDKYSSCIYIYIRWISVMRIPE